MTSREFSCTLLTDGPSDKILKPVIEWAFKQRIDISPEINWMDFSRTGRPRELADRIAQAIHTHPCQTLFVHRDAEGQDSQLRIEEVRRNFEIATNAYPELPFPHYVCIVPIKMTEAWFLFHEQAIRQAAGNPSGRDRIDLPRLNRVEDLADPKAVLHQALITASGRVGRRRQNFNTHEVIYYLADFIEDYSPLRQLSAFQDFENHIERIIRLFKLD